VCKIKPGIKMTRGKETTLIVISTIDYFRFKLNFESTDGQSDLVHFYEHAIIYFEGEINLRLSSKLQ
jgi:hypothetical protein